MNNDNYTRTRIEEAIAELDRPKYAKAIEAGGLDSWGFPFETVLEKSRASREGFLEAVRAMEADNLIMLLEGYDDLTVTKGFRKKHGYYRG